MAGSGNGGTPPPAVGRFAVSQGWGEAPADGIAKVRIWQQNVSKRIVSHVPVRGGEVVEEGDFVLDGVTFPSAEIRIEFLEPGGMGEEGDASAEMFPTGRLRDRIDVPGVGSALMTLITAGNPTVFVDAAALGLAGHELQPRVDTDAELLKKCEAIRAHAAVAMGLARSADDASRNRLHTPKIAWVSPPQSYTASSGAAVDDNAPTCDATAWRTC